MISLIESSRLIRIVIAAGVGVFALVSGSESSSASDWSYCKRRYGPSLATIDRSINGTPCGVECTASRNARFAKIYRCMEGREHARRHAS
jgi:hypothetical protein